MRRNFAWIAIAGLMFTQAAQACGPRCGYHRRHRPARCVVYSYPVPPAYVYAAAAPATPPPATTTVASAATVTPAPAATMASASTTVAPTYEYPAQPAAGTAYYYTYDDSGKLIIQQWGDWLFRGGKEAGMPRPPLPIVGYLQRR